MQNNSTIILLIASLKIRLLLYLFLNKWPLCWSGRELFLLFDDLKIIRREMFTVLLDLYYLFFNVDSIIVDFWKYLRNDTSMYWICFLYSTSWNCKHITSFRNANKLINESTKNIISITYDFRKQKEITQTKAPRNPKVIATMPDKPRW